jgi:hypothetical protein
MLPDMSNADIGTLNDWAVESPCSKVGGVFKLVGVGVGVEREDSDAAGSLESRVALEEAIKSCPLVSVLSGSVIKLYEYLNYFGNPHPVSPMLRLSRYFYPA